MALSLDDRMAIMDLAAAYNQAIDRGDIDAWLATWTVNGVFERPDALCEGPDAMRRFIADFIAKWHPARHWVTNFLIRGGDAATMSSYFNFFGVRGKAKLITSGRYDDTLVKVGDTWKFKHRKVSFDG